MTKNLPTPESLSEQYGSGLHAWQIAERYNVSVWAVITRLKSVGVQMRPNGRPKSLDLNGQDLEDFESLNTGLLLGDASINKKRNFLRIEQSDRRYGLLEWIQQKYSRLGVYSNIIPIKMPKKIKLIDGRAINGGPSSLLYTGVSDEFRALRKYWYPEGRKIVPSSIKLDPLSVAMWICGDGCGSSSGIVIHTNGFVENDVKLLVDQLNVIGIHATKQRHHTRPKEHYIRICRKADLVYLRKIILPYIPECCLYKLRHIREPGELPEMLSSLQ